MPSIAKSTTMSNPVPDYEHMGASPSGHVLVLVRQAQFYLEIPLSIMFSVFETSASSELKASWWSIMTVNRWSSTGLIMKKAYSIMSKITTHAQVI